MRRDGDLPAITQREYFCWTVGDAPHTDTVGSERIRHLGGSLLLQIPVVHDKAERVFAEVYGATAGRNCLLKAERDLSAGWYKRGRIL